MLEFDRKLWQTVCRLSPDQLSQLCESQLPQRRNLGPAGTKIKQVRQRIITCKQLESLAAADVLPCSASAQSRGEICDLEIACRCSRWARMARRRSDTASDGSNGTASNGTAVADQGGRENRAAQEGAEGDPGARHGRGGASPSASRGSLSFASQKPSQGLHRCRSCRRQRRPEGLLRDDSSAYKRITKGHRVAAGIRRMPPKKMDCAVQSQFSHKTDECCGSIPPKPKRSMSSVHRGR